MLDSLVDRSDDARSGDRAEAAAVRRAAGPGVAPFLAMLRLRHAASRLRSAWPHRRRPVRQEAAHLQT